MPNTGQFGAAIGGASPIEEAAARRGISLGATGSVSPAAATAGNNPATMPTPAPGANMPVPGMGGGMAAPQGTAPQGQVTPPGGAPTGQPQGSQEAQIIVRALSDRLKSLGQGGM